MQPVTDITLHRSALNTIIHEAAASLDGRETGGILLGISGDDTVDVRHAGGPGPRAVRSAVTFDRDLHHAQQIAADVWERDGSQWLGEWHTHPNGSIAPSPRDLSSYLAHVRDPELSFTQFVCIIVDVADPKGTPLCAWVITSTELIAATLRACEEKNHAC